MDCLQACEILSAAHDGDTPDPALLAEARDHRATCPECDAFASVLDRIAAVPAPAASSALIARLEELSVSTAAQIRETPPAATAASETPAVEQRQHRTFEWAPRFTALASAAAILLVVLTAGSIALLGRAGQQATDSLERSDEYVASPTTESAAGKSAADAAATIYEQAPAPAYVSLDSAVWALTGDATPDPSVLTTAGAVTSSLDGSVTGEHSAYFAGADRSVLYVRTTDDRYLAFERVMRTLGKSPYGLVTGVPIAAFGQWPTLPERFAQPEEPDGSPTFRLFGFDDEGIDVFVPAGGRITDGFALAPGTPDEDPAAGNPNWTWWEALD